MKKSVVILTLVLAASLGAKEYFVSPSGSDKHSGSKARPFRTVAFAAKKAAAGDTVTLLPGLYRESVTVSKKGKPGAPVTFRGTKDKKGNYLSVIEAPGVTVKKWQPAPEVSPEVWKAPLAKRPDMVLLDGRMITYINSRAMKLAKSKKKVNLITERDIHSRFGRSPHRMPGLDMLGADKNTRMTNSQFGKRKVVFFPSIGNVLSGWKDGYLYIRFANGSTPEKHSISAVKGDGFIVRNSGDLVFRDLHLRGSRIQFQLQNSRNITIDGCLLMHGRKRIDIDSGSSDITVKNSILSLGFILANKFGVNTPTDPSGRVIYIVFKYIVGIGSSDDVGILSKGKNILISGNIISGGLIGINANGPGVEVCNNVVTQMASVGILTGTYTNGRFHRNLVSYCGILLRFHELRFKHAKRAEYHYNNYFLQDRFSGAETYVYCGSHFAGDDKINFEPGTAVYKKNPPKPVYPGDFFIYHNTFWGGYQIAPAFDAARNTKRFREPFPFCLVNNIMRYSFLLNNWQHVFDNNLLYAFSSMAFNKKGDPDIVKNNKVLSLEASKKIWKNGMIKGVPDIELCKDSNALGVGIDVSKPFSFRGRNYPALPGFKPGYFKGKAPAAGALQQHESMEHFAKLASQLAAAKRFID